MNPRKLDRAFNKFLSHKRIDPAVSPEIGVQAMIDFYLGERADGCDGSEQDMLLFQWGTYDWGNGKHFEVDMVRQVILPDQVDDDAIWQLHLTYRAAPSPARTALGSGNRWCSSRSEVAEFESFLRCAPATTVIAAAIGATTSTMFECAG